MAVTEYVFSAHAMFAPKFIQERLSLPVEVNVPALNVKHGDNIYSIESKFPVVHKDGK